MKTVKTFKYLGSMFNANGGAEKDVNNRVKIAWSKWRETTGVMCDRNIPTKLKDKVSVLPRLLLQGAAPCPLSVTPCPFEKAEMTLCPFD